MNETEKEHMFKLMDKYVTERTDDGYCAMEIEQLIVEYVKSRHLDIEWIEVY